MKKILTLVCSLLACASSFALAQGNQPVATEPKDLPPSPLEAFASRPTTKIVWSTTVGHLESSYSRAILEVIILQDQATPAKMMRGLRIKLAHNGLDPSCDWKYSAWQVMCKRPNASVYIEESRMEAVRIQLMRGAAELRPMEFISEYATNSPDVSPTGLIICGYDFPDRGSAELAELFTRAIAELNTEPH